MADVRVKWIKIYTNMVSNKKIRRIRTLPEGNNIILIWVFLIAQAGESNKNGALYLTDTIPFTPEDLAIEFDFDTSIIKFALITLEKYSMIEVFEDVIYIKNWDEYQNIEGLEKIKIQNRDRKRVERANKKQLLLKDKESRDSHATVTQSHATEIELELEREIEIIPYSEIIDYLNIKANKSFSPKTEATVKFINGRWAEGKTIDDFKRVIDVKCKEWLGKKNREGKPLANFLRPNTLFSPTNFENYLNQVVGKPTEGRVGVTVGEEAGIRRPNM